MKKRSFKKGIHPQYCKEATEQKKILRVDPKQELVYPMQQHIGAPCKSLVKKGDRVLVGQKIGEPTGAVAAPIHSTVSGSVKVVEERLTLAGKRVQAVVVVNDFEYEKVATISEEKQDYTNQTTEALVACIKEAGIVGMGGATFPTFIKLSVPQDKKVDTIIINAAECEPYLTSDHRVMLEESDQILEGMAVLLHMFKDAKIVVGIEDNKEDAAEILSQKLSQQPKVEVMLLETKYPQGSEKQLIDAVTHREVPGGMLPIDKGCIVLNVDTVVAIGRAVTKGMPLMRRIVTVSGEGVEKPGNFEVRLGMSVRELLEEAGWQETATSKVIAGGPMMGTAISDVDVPIVKGTSAILCLTEKQAALPEETACIRCGKCIDVCPMHLMPNVLQQAAANQDEARFTRHFGMDCIECGSCVYSCPAKRQIVQRIRTQKNRMRR